MIYDKASFAVRHAASKEVDRYALQGIRFEKDKTVATDRRVLAIIDAVPADVAEGLPEAVTPTFKEPFTIESGDSARIASMIPKLRFKRNLEVVTVQQGKDDTKVTFTSTNLSAVDKTEVRKLEGMFPDHVAIIPKGKPEATRRIGLGVMLKAMAVLKDSGVESFHLNIFPLVVAKNGNITDGQISMEATRQDGRKVYVLVMPLRDVGK